MDVRKHRIAALTILASEVVVLLAWGRSMALESDEVRAVRDRLRGSWVASSIRAGQLAEVAGATAGRCSVDFDGKKVALRGLVGDLDATGTYYIESAHPDWVDFKLDAGWIVGIFSLEGDALKLCVNPFAPPERLGVPTLGRPRDYHPGKSRNVYVFRKATPGR